MKRMKFFFPFRRRPQEARLCLSGGGALGFAHVGVIQALEEHGIRPAHVSGTSMGAIVGAFYAAGLSPAQMLDVIKEHKLYRLSTLLTFQADFWRRGLSDHTTLRRLVRELIPHNSFEGLERRLTVCVSDMNRATWRLVDAGGDLDRWVAASASIPGVFKPMEIDGTLYMDGGVMNNMPAQCFECHFRTTIGVDVIPYPRLDVPPLSRVSEVAMTAIRAMQYRNAREGRDICSYLIEPLVLNQYHEFSFEAYREIYDIGYRAATDYIRTHRDILALGQ